MGSRPRDLEHRLEKIRRRAIEEPSLHLSLAGLELEAVPEWVLELELLTLDLSRNALTTLPPELGLLDRLEVLWVQHNALVEVPRALAELDRLQELYLGHNRVAQLPDWLGSMPALEYLQLSRNPIDAEALASFAARYPGLRLG